MSSVLQAIQAEVAAAIETAADMTVAVKGGGAKLIPEAYYMGRLVEYVELGMQPQEYQGKAKDPALEVQLGFALWNSDGTGLSEDGSPYIMRPYSFAISRNEKAKAFLLFKSLNWLGTATHFAQLLGQAFLVKVVNSKPTDPSKPVRSQIDLKGFLPALDPMTKQPYPVPVAPDNLYKWFIWDKPALAQWDTLFVEGAWDDGSSKNRTQETILGAVDFSGSALETLLMQNQRQFKAPPKALVAAQPALAMPPVVPTATVAPTPVLVAPAVPVFVPPKPPVFAVPTPPVFAMPAVPAQVPGKDF